MKRVILLTGVSSGIGLALAKKLLALKQDYVIATVRAQSRSALEKNGIKQTSLFWIREMDVTSDNDRKRVIAEIKEKLGRIDVIINNAGISYRAVVEHMSEEDELKQISTNYLGPIGLIRHALPIMRNQQSGKIINVSSVSGMMSMPTMSSYSASKWALEGATEALWYEMKPWNIQVSLIQPGFIHSDSFKNVYKPKCNEEPYKQVRDPYHHYYENMTPFIEKMMRLSRTTADDVADVIIDVMNSKSPKLRVAGTFDARVFYILRRILPRRFYHYMLYKFLPKIKEWAED